MKPIIKVGLFVSGYIAAFLIAWTVVANYIARTDTPDRQASSGMYAFGDGLLFLGVLGLAGVPATGAMLFSLRPCRPFWRAISIAALVVGASGLAALMDFILCRDAPIGSQPANWCALAVLRILIAPLLALAFLLSTVFAPIRSSRIALFAATAGEATIFLYWWSSLRSAG